MPVSAPTEGYAKMISYGQKKAALRIDQLALQAFLAGFWVSIYGHACGIFASNFYDETYRFSAGLTSLAYGALFPGAFVAVVYTGTELFTGNTVTMCMLVFHEGKCALMALVRVWFFSLVGNLAGAIFGAFFFTFLSGAFHSGPQQAFLFNLTNKKTDRNFGQNVILGVGCNALVCLATWCVVVSDDGAGKILAIFYSIGVFAMGGFEHVVANFYTLSAALMCGYTGHSWGEIIWKNWLPVLLGNLIAGTLFTGVMWWYALHPQFSDLAPFTNAELATELSKRVGTIDLERDPTDTIRWKRSGSAQTHGSFFVGAHRLVPATNIQKSSPCISNQGTPKDSPSIWRNPLKEISKPLESKPLESKPSPSNSNADLEASLGKLPIHRS